MHRNLTRRLAGLIAAAALAATGILPAAGTAPPSRALVEPAHILPGPPPIIRD